MEFDNYRVSKGKTTSYVDLFGYFFLIAEEWWTYKMD